MIRLFESYGIATDSSQLRAMSAEEILAHQIKQQIAWQQATPDSYSMEMNITNWMPPERPLDERFADFKVRLAAAIEQHERKKGPTP